MEEQKTKKEFIVIHEHVFSSWLKDTYSFVVIFFLLYLNAHGLGNHASIAVLLVIFGMMLLWVGRPSKAIKHFTDKEEAKKHIDKL